MDLKLQKNIQQRMSQFRFSPLLLRFWQKLSAGISPISFSKVSFENAVCRKKSHDHTDWKGNHYTC